MCSVRASALTALSLLLGGPAAGTPASLGAQTPTPEELEARIDSLLPIRDRIRRRARRADSLARVARMKRNAVETEKIRVGPLTVVAPLDQAERARAVMGEVWERYEPFFKDPPLDLFQDEIFTFQVYTRSRANIYVQAPQERVHRVEIRAFYGEERLREKAATLVAQVLSRRLDSQLRDWAGLAAPGGLRTGAWDARVYREMVTAPSVAVRSCFQGDVELCWAATGAAAETENSWERLYTPMERVDLARRAGRPWASRSRETAVWEECLAEHVDGACLEFLRTRYGDRADPLSGPVRSSLLTFALDRGGRGAFTRLIESEGEIRQRLAEAAGMEPRQLLTAWLDHVRDARPLRGEGEPATRLSTLFWVLALGFLATRSTRWRLG